MSAKYLLAVGAGSFVGGVARYLVSLAIRPGAITHFPWNTFIVNIAGCFLIGIAFGFFERGTTSHGWRLFITTGLLGGFTTFSAFSIETVNLFKEKHTTAAILYVSLSVVIGLLVTLIAYNISKKVI